MHSSQLLGRISDRLTQHNTDDSSQIQRPLPISPDILQRQTISNCRHHRGRPMPTLVHRCHRGRFAEMHPCGQELESLDARDLLQHPSFHGRHRVSQLLPRFRHYGSPSGCDQKPSFTPATQDLDWPYIRHGWIVSYLTPLTLGFNEHKLIKTSALA